MFILSRRKFLLISFSAFVLYFVSYKLSFLYNSSFTTGEIIVLGHIYGRSTNSHPIVEMTVENEKIRFVGESGSNDHLHEKVNVVYKNDDPTDAKIFSFRGFWFSSMLYALFPLIIFAAFVLSFVEKDERLVIDYKRFLQKKEERAPFKFKIRIGEEEKSGPGETPNSL